MTDLLEFVMMVCFGLSWPVNLIRNIKSRSSKGCSLLFYLLIAVGYICGIAAKLGNKEFMMKLDSKWFLLACYIANLINVVLNIAVYFRNRKLEKLSDGEL